VEAIRFGALDFIVKPFKPDRILQTVSKVLG
ncbi:MAG: two-component system response regulator, partial [Hydrogenoanaerobacterium sp.]